MVFLDIAASHEGRATLVDLVRRTSEQVRSPSRWVVASDQSRASPNCSAQTKVSLNSSAVRRPGLVRRGRIASAANALSSRSCPSSRGGRLGCLCQRGRENTGLDVVEWARQVADLGAGEILLTSMDGDGTQAECDLELTRAVSQAVPVPVIASGGAGCLDHIARALDGGPDGGQASAALLVPVATACSPLKRSNPICCVGG